MSYSTYEVEDFVTDPYFIQWVKNPSEECVAFWNAWLSANPAKEDIIREARELVLVLTFQETPAPEGKFLEIWEMISDSADRKAFDLYADKSVDRRGRVNLRRWYRVAAVFLVAAASAVFVLLMRPDTVIVRTAFGESRVLFLPDSSKVTMNANSTLRYRSDFNERNREVWLDGEAFFAVVHKKDNQNFRVHTDELALEVLGTRFNVNSRRGRSKVILEEGKVKLDIPRDGKNMEVIMKPGELVEVSAATREVEKKEVEPDNYSSWRSNKLIFVSASLGEIAELLEDNYGFAVTFRDERLKVERFTGSSSVDNPDELIAKLNKVFGLNIQRHGNDLIFQYE